MKKKFGIVAAGFPNDIILQSDSVTDEIRQYLRANPTTYLVKRSMKHQFGYSVVKMFIVRTSVE